MHILKSQKYYSRENYIEVIGMPASGKSTLVKKLYFDEDKYYDVNSNLPKNKYIRLIIRIIYSILAILYSPKEALKDIRVIISSKQKTKKDLIIVTVNWLFIIYACNYRKNKNILWVWDQGIFQAIWSIAFSSQKEVEYIQLLKNKNLPQKVHFTDADDETLRRRAAGRKVFIRLDYRNNEDVIQARKSLGIVLDLLERCNYSNDSFVYWKEG